LRVLLAILVALAGRAAAGEFRLPPVTRVTLENGLRLVVAEQREVPLVEMQLVVGAGSAQDPAGDEGVAALTARTLTRGAGARSAVELARAIESLGGEVSAGAGTDGTIIGAEFLAEDFARGLGLVRDVVMEPRFEKDEVRRARDDQVSTILATLEQPSAVADKCFGAFLYGSHPYGRPTDGRIATVRDLGRGDVRDFYERWYHPNNTIMVLVGAVSPDEAVTAVRQAFGAWKADPEAVPERAAPPPPLAARRVLLVDKPDATQTQIRFGNVGMKRSDPDYLVASVANTILGGGFTSRLIEELRIKRSLTYSAWSMFNARLLGGDFRVGTFTKSPTTVETLRLALSVEGEFRTTPPDAKGLDKAKAYLRGQFPLRLESPEALAARLAELEFHGLPQDELTTYQGRVAAVSAADVTAVAAKRMPAPEGVAIVVVGKAAELKGPLEEAFGAVETVPAAECDDPGRVAR
jgi:predicted Zn-dependent peptidase